MEKADVWLDHSDDEDEGDHFSPDDFNSVAGWKRGTANEGRSDKACSEEYSSTVVQYRDICTGTKGTLHKSWGTFSKADPYGGGQASLSDPGIVANTDQSPERTQLLS